MKTLFAAVAVLASAVAFAEGDKRAIDASEVGPSIERKAEKTKKDATDVGREAKANAKEWGKQAGMATETQGTFKREAAFDLSGTASRTKGGKVTLEREGLPPATLDVRDETKVTLDGRKVDAKYIPEGAMVRAKFQLEGNATVAVELNATTGIGGSGEMKRDRDLDVDLKKDYPGDKTGIGYDYDKK